MKVQLKYSDDEWCEKKVWFMRKAVNYYRVVGFEAVLKCILTCNTLQRPPITNKMTSAEGARFSYVFY